MENLTFTPKGIRLEAKGLLTDNWSRALATLCMSLFALAAFLLFNRLVTTLIGLVDQMGGAVAEEEQLQSVLDYFRYYKDRGFQLGYAVSVVLTAFFFMLAAPLNLGVVMWYQSLAQCGDLKVGQIFYYYRGNQRYIDALVFELSRVGRHIFFGALCLAPSVVCFAQALNRAAEEGRWPTTLLAAAAALLVAGLLIYAAIMLRWFVAKYLFVSGARKNVGQSFSTSARYMKGCSGRVLRVMLSFVPLLLTCVLIAPAVYVIPTFNASMAACAQDIIDARTPA